MAWAFRTPIPVRGINNMQSAKAVSADGLWVDLSVDHMEGGAYGKDFSGGLHDFKNTSPERYRLTAKADPVTDPKALISALRAGIEEISGAKPAVMPPSHVSGLIEFEWPAEYVEEEAFLRRIVSVIEASSIGRTRPKAPDGVSPKPMEAASPRSGLGHKIYEERLGSLPPEASKPRGKQCEFCGRTNDGSWQWSNCSNCGGSFCPEHAEPAEHNCADISRSKRILAGPGARPRRSHRRAYVLALILVAILLVAALPYYSPDQLLPLASFVGSAESGIYAWVNRLLHPPASSPGTNDTQSITSTTQTQPTTTQTPPPTSTTTTSTTTTTTQTSGTNQPLGRFVPSLPDFIGGAANVSFPAIYQAIANYSLGLINVDRAAFGLSPVTLSPVSSGQQHANSMLYYGYFSHWDVQGYKPYMRYTMLGGTGLVAENAGLTYCTTSTPQSAMLYPTTCTLQTLEKGIASSEWNMMYNDADQENGHRNNILNPTRNRVSIGVSYDTVSEKVYFVEDFEDYLINMTELSLTGSTVTLRGSPLTPTDYSQGEVTVMYDPTPVALTTSDLNSSLYSDGYSGGISTGAVFTPCPAGYTCSATTVDGLIAAYATTWQSTGSSLVLQFSLTQFVTEYGSGFYTLYLWHSQTANDPVTSISFRVSP